jgi:hypothetical protein
MKAVRLPVLVLVVVGLTFSLSGCKLIESLMDKYVNNRLQNLLDQTNEGTIDGRYQAAWTLSEETCNPDRIGDEGTSTIAIVSDADAGTAAVTIDGWLVVPDAEVDGSTVRGTAQGVLADDGACDYDAVAQVELTVDTKHKTLSGIIEMSYAHQSFCAAEPDGSCDAVKVY